MLGQSPVFTQPDAPLQIYHLQSDDITCTCVEAAPALSQLVHYYWLMRVAAPSTHLSVIPDNATDLVLSPDIDGFAAVYTPVAQPFQIPLEGPVTFVGASLQTGAVAKFFGASMADLAALAAGEETAQQLDASDLCLAVRSVQDEAALKTCFDEWFTARLARGMDGAAQPLPRAGKDAGLIDMLSDSLDNEGLQSVTEALGVSERQFRRLASDLIGLSPKKAQRVVRLQRALRELLGAGSAGVNDHFFDEAHYIRELRALTGLTPGKIRKLAEKYNSSG